MINLLIICTHNRCRSILAEAIARQHCPALRVFSAGSAPAGQVHPSSIAFLQQAGYSTEDLCSQSWDAVPEPIDIVITVCDRAANESCPLYLGSALKIHWGLPDPSSLAMAQQPPAFEALIDTLERRFSMLQQQLQQPDACVKPALFAQIAEAVPAPQFNR